MARRTNAVRALSRKTWGAATSNLRMVYTAFIRSCVEHAAAGWMPSNRERLEIAQCRKCRVINGCLKSTLAAALERKPASSPSRYADNSWAGRCSDTSKTYQMTRYSRC